MKSQVVTILCLLWASELACCCGDDAAPKIPFRVVGYLPDYRFTQFNADAAASLTDLILFSAEPQPDGGLSVSRLENCPWNNLLKFKTRNRVRLILSVGGWERSSGFSSLTRSNSKRRRFVESTVKFCLEHRLDGIDIDWEHPANEEEVESYGQFLADIHAALEPHGLMLSVTIAAWQKLSTVAVSAVDSVQIMAYDHDRQHSTFEDCEEDVRRVIESGVPRSKIVLGLPFYGRDVESREAMTYAEIVSKFLPAPDKDQIGNIYFNGPVTVQRKTQFAVSSRLGGVMVWELGQDATNEHSLLGFISDTVKETQK